MTFQSAKVLVHPEPPVPVRPARAKAVIFADPKSQALLDQIDRIANTEATVLIFGETGTGKEIIARHVHTQSKRQGAFVAVNCGALSASLADSELFGHQVGAFTGANESRAGWFEAANNGTLFLDEIGDLPLALQVKLLRVIQEREVVRLGSRKPISLNVRIVAATNVDLAQAVAAGRFRLDLYYRLNVAAFELAPLRARRGDILPLVDYFLRTYSHKLQVEMPTLLAETRQALVNYSWPGNIRELENVIHYALLVTSDRIMRPEDLRFVAIPQLVPAAADQESSSTPLEMIATQLERLFGFPPPDMYQALESLIVKNSYRYCNGNQVQTARLLGVSRNILRTQLKRLGLLGKESEADSEIEPLHRNLANFSAVAMTPQ